MGGNLPDGFPTIDKWDNGTATSIKSVDLLAPTYQDPSSLGRVLNGYVDKVADFKSGTRANVRVRADQVVSRQLEIAVPKGSTSASQRAVLDAVAARAETKGVRVIVREID